MEKLRLIQIISKYFFISGFFFMACNEEPIKYYHIINGSNKTTIEGKVKTNREEGEWSISTSTGKLLANGKYSNGLKEGNWEYNLDDTIFEISWKKYENKTKGIKINLPQNWTTIEHKDELVQAIFRTKSKHKRNKYLLVGKYNMSDIGLTIEEYIKLSELELSKHSKIKDNQSFIVHNGDNQYHFSRFIIIREGEKMVVYNFIRLINEDIIDVGYSSLNEEKEYKNILFFEILIGCYYEGIRILDPLKKLYFRKK